MVSHNLNNTADYLKMLGKHGELIAKIYHDGGIVSQNHDNQHAITQLVQQRILVRDVQDDYRLNPPLSRHLDDVSQRQRLYAVGANLADKIDSLEPLSNEYLLATQDGRFDDADNYGHEFDMSIFDLAISVDGELLHLRSLVENRFAHVSTVAEKKRQNEFYLERSQRIGLALEALQHGTLWYNLQNHVYLNDLQAMFQRQIDSRISQWRVQHFNITDMLKAYLFKLREIAPKAQRLRSFGLFLTKHPSYEPPDISELLAPPLWSQRMVGLALRAHVDIAQAVVRDQLAEMASRIPAAKIVSSRQRQHGQLVGMDTEAAVIQLQPSLTQLALIDFWRQALQSVTPLSALAWKRQRSQFASLVDSVWLMVLWHSLDVDSSQKNHPLQHLQIQRCEAEPRHTMSGNIVIEDIQAWKKS